MTPPRATYRFQFHKDFTFADAEALVPYLDELGISHLYASPVTTATPGSTHGYDVTDPTAINPELGGEAGFRALVAALRARGMGIVIDIVPNHMGVAGDGNAWWRDVLTHGPDGEHATVFDIDWRVPVVLPVLGAPLSKALADGDLALEKQDDRWTIVAYGEHRFPVRDADQTSADTLPLADLLARQHYRLAFWRVANDELNWRRFFSINELAGVRIEDPAVFEKTHALYFRLHDEGLIDGVRIDHVDGLTDPIGYTRRLRERLGPDAWIVIEKILAAGEPQPLGWGVDGTSGYDFMEQVAALLHDPAGAEPLGALWEEISGRSATFEPEEFQARQDLLAWQFSGQLDACVAAFAAVAPDGVTDAMLRRAIKRLLWVFPVYRTYGPDAPASDDAIRALARTRVAELIPPGEAHVADLILSWLGGEGGATTADAVRRFQQLSAPIAAKAVEDTGFYRYGRLLSRNDVGFDADRMATTPAEFHALMMARARDVPRAMLTTATHDHKRGEDTRARLAAISAQTAAWREAALKWLDRDDNGVDDADRYMLFQTLIGAWSNDGANADFVERIKAWQQKALREAKLRSSWEAPDETYEQAAAALVEALPGDPAAIALIEGLVATLDAAAQANTLAQVVLRYTLPGVPDLYQGTEFADLSLVDPDNRRPVDYPARQAALAAGTSPKLRLIADLLRLRREDPGLFADGDYVPATVDGGGEGGDTHVIAFERRHGDRGLRVAVALHGRRPAKGTRIAFASGGTVDATTLFDAGSIWYERS
ncbi:malto-oligosyltrehalose synthase [Sphingomonas sp. Leaf231]|uniref:malto-oligosyltrehalose synthase n=1 Tax=Sphingomonas sp. Leaf231 TaxID=1736301 RepID=UPI0006F9D501|nr:malto-oligosyltrehalose synthase [Sphingomonas sp. Leaf231]KQN93140.1 malto-oligosyltrehalose synthase [Sphingomonas sp. Leaf231]